MSSMLDPQELGRKFGHDIFEQTRRRFAQQFATQRGQQRQRFASRGAIGSSAAASAGRDLERAEQAALADASLGSQIQGTQFGFQEAGRQEGIRQFGETLGFQKEALAAQRIAQREALENALKLQRLRGSQSLELARLQQMIGQQGRRSDLLGAIFGAGGSLLGGPLAGILGGLFAGGGGGGSSAGNILQGGPV